jgi:hypothetical protein
MRNVLEFMVAGILEGGVDLAADLPEGVVGNANAAGFGDALQPRGNVDSIAEDVAFLDDDVADVNPDAQFDAPVGRLAGIALSHAALLLDSAAVAPTALLNSIRMPSPVRLTIRPRCSAIVGSGNSRRWALSRARVPSSSAPISLL